MTAWKVGRFGGSATLKKRTLREQQLQIEHDKTTLLTKLDLYSHPRQAVTSYCKFFFFFLTCRTCGLKMLRSDNHANIQVSSISNSNNIVFRVLYYRIYGNWSLGQMLLKAGVQCFIICRSWISHLEPAVVQTQSKSAVVWERQLVLIKSSLKVRAETKEINGGKQEI